MEFPHFVTLYLLFMINIFHKSNSLLSRSKNTYLYLPQQFDYVEPIDPDDIYNVLKEEVPGIEMFKNEFDKVFKNVFNPRLQTGRQANRNIFAKGMNREKIMILSTQPPVTIREKKRLDLVWGKMRTSSTQLPEMIRNWHYIRRILHTSTTPSIFIIHPTEFQVTLTNTSNKFADFFGSTTKTNISTSKKNTANYQFVPIPPSWNEDYDTDDDKDEDKDNFDESNQIIVNFENYTYRIPYTTVTTTETVTTTTTAIQTTTTTVQTTTTTIETFTPTVNRNQTPSIAIEQTTERQLPDNFVIFEGIRKGQCYRCGTETGLSKKSFCHDVFDSNNYDYTSLTTLLRITCYDNPSVRHGEKVKWPKGYDEFKLYQYTDQGLESKFYGSYSGGCFKRFLDIGTLHTQRGCRQWPPDGYRFRRGYFDHPTTQQYRRLEKKLGKSERDACVYSLHASLVPFSRDISLFARHHVCVCKGRYCNEASNIYASFVSSIVGIIYLLKSYYHCYFIFLHRGMS